MKKKINVKTFEEHLAEPYGKIGSSKKLI